MLATMFDTTVARLGLNQRACKKDGDGVSSDDEEATTFRRPPKLTKQLSLF